MIHPTPAAPADRPTWSAELARALELEAERLNQVSAARQSQLDGLEAALAAQLQAVASRLSAEITARQLAAEQELERERLAVASRVKALDDEQAEIERLEQRTQRQRTRLAQRLRAARANLAEGRVAGQGKPAADSLRLDAHGALAAQENEHLKRRLDRALEEIDLLRARQREAAAGGHERGDAPMSGPLDWETQKQMLLAALEADAAGGGEPSEERLTIEGTIRITDAIVVEKEQEIRELKQLLDAQSQSVGSVAVGAAALGSIFDADELITQERHRLAHLQQEWEEKLRAAEIDLSVERAKLARQRAELEEQRRSLEEAASRVEKPPVETAEQPTNRGRWLTRLGLKESG